MDPYDADDWKADCSKSPIYPSLHAADRRAFLLESSLKDQLPGAQSGPTTGAILGS